MSGFIIPDSERVCPDCEGNLIKIGIDLYRCTKCRETFEAREVKD